MNKLNILLISVFALLFTGCATKLGSYTTNDQLEEGNGWLVLNVVSPNPEISLELSDSNKRYKTPGFKKGITFQVMQLPVGDYHISGVYDRSAKWELKQFAAQADFSFAIESGSATLVGDVTLDGNSMSLQPFVASASDVDDYAIESLVAANDLRLVIVADNNSSQFWGLSLHGCRSSVGVAVGNGCGRINGTGAVSVRLVSPDL